MSEKYEQMLAERDLTIAQLRAQVSSLTVLSKSLVEQAGGQVRVTTEQLRDPPRCLHWIRIGGGLLYWTERGDHAEPFVGPASEGGH